MPGFKSWLMSCVPWPEMVVLSNILPDKSSSLTLACSALVFITRLIDPSVCPVITFIEAASSFMPVVFITWVVLTVDQALSPHAFWPLAEISALPVKDELHVTTAVSLVPAMVPAVGGTRCHA